MKQLARLLTPYLIRLPWALLGGVAGYRFYQGYLCTSGICLLTSPPLFAILMGGLTGLLLRELLAANPQKTEEP